MTVKLASSRALTPLQRARRAWAAQREDDIAFLLRAVAVGVPTHKLIAEAQRLIAAYPER